MAPAAFFDVLCRGLAARNKGCVLIRILGFKPDGPLGARWPCIMDTIIKRCV
jgi:hypothetical protein